MINSEHGIKIPRRIKIGGFDYKIFIGGKDHELRSDSTWAKGVVVKREIWIEGDMPSSQQLSETFIHEILHSVSDIYCGHKLEEEQVSGLGHGLLQVFEQLGVRFEK